MFFRHWGLGLAEDWEKCILVSIPYNKLDNDWVTPTLVTLCQTKWNTSKKVIKLFPSCKHKTYLLCAGNKWETMLLCTLNKWTLECEYLCYLYTNMVSIFPLFLSIKYVSVNTHTPLIKSGKGGESKVNYIWEGRVYIKQRNEEKKIQELQFNRGKNS